MYYKLTNCIMQSCNTKGEYCIQYHFNDWVRPEIGKIFTFDSILHLREFTGRYGLRGRRIFECTVMNPYVIGAVCYSEDIENFWKEIPVWVTFAPIGTVGGDAVLLLREITNVLLIGIR